MIRGLVRRFVAPLAVGVLVLLWFATPAIAQSAETGATRVTWIAALLIALLYYLSQSAWLAGLGFWTLYRPLVSGVLVGAILGDPATGLRAGATINLAYLGFLATGGQLPADISLAGYIGTSLVVAGGLDVQAALAVTVPVGILGYWIYQLRMNLDVFFVHWADRCAARGDARGVGLVNAVPGQLLLLVLSTIPCFLGVYLGPQWLGEWVMAAPAWVLAWLDTVGALLPALGIAMSMNLLWHTPNMLLFSTSLIAASLLHANPLVFGMAALGLALARYAVSKKQRRGFAQPCVPPAASGSSDVGGRLPKSTLLASFLNWLFFSHACYNYERMQGIGFAHAMAPLLRKICHTRESLAEALQRHLVFYNAEPNLGALVLGVVAALEEQRAAGGDVSVAAIQATKASLMGVVSGVGDTLIQGALAPALLSLGVGLAMRGSYWGPVLYTLSIAGIVWGLGWWAMVQGYRSGTTWLLRALQSGRWRDVVAAAELVGAGMLGALGASVLTLRTPVLAGLFGEGRSSGVVAWERLPGALLSLGLVLAYIAALRWRAKPWQLVLVTFALGLIGHRVSTL